MYRSFVELGREEKMGLLSNRRAAFGGMKSSVVKKKKELRTLRCFIF
jgi:hypothetical protein